MCKHNRKILGKSISISQMIFRFLKVVYTNIFKLLGYDILFVIIKTTIMFTGSNFFEVIKQFHYLIIYKYVNHWCESLFIKIIKTRGIIERLGEVKFRREKPEFHQKPEHFHP